MKPHYDWCAGCIKQIIVNTPIKFKARPTFRDLKPAFSKIKAENAALRAEVRQLREEMKFVIAKVGGPPRQSLVQQVRALAELTPESVATVVGKPESVRKEVCRERKRRRVATASDN